MGCRAARHATERYGAPRARMRIYVPRVVADRIMMQDDFVRLHEFLLETDTISDISDDLREVVEKEWPELAHKLPPKRGPPRC